MLGFIAYSLIFTSEHGAATPDVLCAILELPAIGSSTAKPCARR
jgi:hypothetical protein